MNCLGINKFQTQYCCHLKCILFTLQGTNLFSDIYIFLLYCRLLTLISIFYPFHRISSKCILEPHYRQVLHPDIFSHWDYKFLLLDRYRFHLNPTLYCKQVLLLSILSQVFHINRFRFALRL